MRQYRISVDNGDSEAHNLRSMLQLLVPIVCVERELIAVVNMDIGQIIELNDRNYRNTFIITRVQ